MCGHNLLGSIRDGSYNLERHIGDAMIRQPAQRGGDANCNLREHEDLSFLTKKKHIPNSFFTYYFLQKYICN